MTNGAAFTHRFMLKNEGAALGDVALKASIVLVEKCHPAAMNALSHARAATFHDAALVWFVTIRATHFSFQNRVAMRQLKLPAHVQMAGEAGFRRFPGIDDQTRRATALRMETARAVAGLTSDVYSVRSRRFQPCMRGRAEITHELLMAISALFRADKLRTGYTRRSDDRTITVDRFAGEESQSESVCSARTPKQAYATSVEPPNEFGVAHSAGSKKKNQSRQRILRDKMVTQCFCADRCLDRTPDNRVRGFEDRRVRTFCLGISAGINRLIFTSHRSGRENAASPDLFGGSLATD